MTPPVVFRSSGVEIDVGARRVRRDGTDKHLRQQAMQLLCLLIINRERLVSKEELISAVWRDVAVTDEAVTQCVKEIRRALGDDAKAPRFIRTVPKAGYQFIAAVEAVSSSPQSEPVGLRSAGESVPVLPGTSTGLRAVFGGAVLILIVVGTAAWWTTSPQRPTRGATDMGATLVDGRSRAALSTNVDAERAYARGLELARELRGPEAIGEFSRAIAIDRDFALAHARIGYVLTVVNGRTGEARPHLERALALSPRLTGFDRTQVQAWYALASGDQSTAIDLYRSIVRTRPADEEGHRRLGILLAGEERFDEAIAALEGGLAVLPDEPALLNPLALLLADVGQFDRASANIDRLLAARPYEANLHDSAGLVYDAAGRYDEAVAAYDRAIELDPAFLVAQIHRANVLYRRGQYREALAALDACLPRAKSDAERSRVEFSRAWVQHRLGDVDRARATAKHARQLDPTGTPIWMDVVLRDPGGAWTMPAQVVKVVGRGSRVSPRLELVRQGHWALSMGRGDEALGWFHQAVAHRPVPWNIETFDEVLGDGYAALGRLDEAIAEYEKVLTAKPWLARVRYHLARAYDQRGDAARAQISYRQFLAGWPHADRTSPEVLAATARLDSAGRRH